MALVVPATPSLGALTENWKLEAPQVLKSATIVSKQLTANVVTINTAAPHNFAIGEQVYVTTDGSAVTDNIAPKDAAFSIVAVPSATSFTYARTAANSPLTSVAGTARVFWLGTSYENRGLAFNQATGHVLVARGQAALTAGVHAVNFDGTDVGELKMGADISSKARATNVVTLTTVQPHGLALNQSVFVMCNPPDTTIDGVVTVTGVPTANDFTFAKTGADIAATPTGGTTNIAVTGTVSLDKIRAVNGKIYACSLSINTNSLTDVFAVYYWASESAVPVVIQRNTALSATGPSTFAVGPRLPAAAAIAANNARIGDTFDVVADGLGAVELYTLRPYQGAAAPLSRVYKLLYTENTAAVSAANEITLTGNCPNNVSANAGGIFVEGMGGNIIVSTSAETGTWDNAGAARTPTLQAVSPGDYNSGVITSNSGGRAETVSGKKYYAYIERGTSGHPDAINGYGRAALADVTAGYPSAAYVDNTGARENWVRSNGNGSGDIAWDDQTARSGRFFAMPTCQYVGSYSVPAVVAPSAKTWDGGASSNKWTDGANWNPDGVPTTNNDVVLDHSSVAGAYTVQIAGLHTVICRTLTIDAANAATIKLRASGEGEACGTPLQFNGAGLSDISVTGAYALPATKDDSTAPRFRVEILKGISAVTTKAITANVATLGTLSAFATNANNLAIGDTITVALNPADPAFDGTYTVTAVAAASVSYAKTNADVVVGPAYGTVAPAIETIRWNNIGSATVFANGAAGIFGQAGATGVAIAAATPIPMSDGFSVQFAAATGHNTGDAWIFNPKSVGNALVIKGDGTAANDVVVQNGGVLENYVTSRFAYVPQTFNVWGGGNTCFFGAAGTYVHGAGIIAVSTQWPSDWTAAPISYPVFDGATTWDTASNNVTDTYPSGAAAVPANYPTVFRSMQFGGLEVRNSYAGLGLASNYSNVANATSLRVKGNLNIGAGSSLTIQTSANVLLEGDVTNNGNATGLSLQTGANPAVQFNGNTTYSGSSLGNTLATGYTVNAGKTLTLSGVDITVPATKTASVLGTLNTDSAMTVAGTLSVAGLLNPSINPIGGAGALSVLAGGTLNVKTAGGLATQVAVAGAKTYDGAAKFVYNGTMPQVLSNALPSTVDSLTINNPAGVTLTDPLVTSASLVLESGELATGSNSLTVDVAGSVTRTAGFVNGTLSRNIDASVTGVREFPVGTTGAYAPASINITGAGTGTGTVSAETVATDAAGLTQPLLAIDRHWNLNASGISGYTAELVFQYPAGDVTGGTEANFVALRNNGIWSAPGTSTIDTVNHKATVSGITGLSIWTVGEPAALTSSVNDWMLF